MFGTIGHARLKPGSDAQLAALMDEWKRTIRPTIPGSILELTGKPWTTVRLGMRLAFNLNQYHKRDDWHAGGSQTYCAWRYDLV